MNQITEADSLEALDILRILELIPHRYPFLLVDRIYDIVPLESAVGVKNVTFNEPQFTGHFPGHPIMPGVLIVEAIAQTAAAMAIHSMGDEAKGKLVYFLSIDDCKFRKPVRPGDTMHIHVSKDRRRGDVWRFFGAVKVDEKVVTEARCAAMIVDPEARS